MKAKNPILFRKTAAPASPAAGHVALYSVDGTALLMKDESGAVVTLAGPVSNCAVVTTTPTGATDTYLAGSDVAIPNGRLQAKSRYKMQMFMSKTGAGVASVVLAVRLGTAGSTADTARATLTFAVQTAAADEGVIDLDVYFRTVGSGTSAIIRAEAVLAHRLAASGWCSVNSSIQGATSAGFDSTVAGLKIGCSVILGSATIGTVTSVGADLFDLA